MVGYYKIYRGVFQHQLFKGEKFNRLTAWLWLIENANYKDGRHIQNYKTYEIKRGELATSYRALAREWGWSVNTVIKFIKLLGVEHMVDTKCEHNFVHLTICKYEEYQGNGNAARTQLDTKVETENDTKLIKEKERQYTKAPNTIALPSFREVCDKWKTLGYPVDTNTARMYFLEENLHARKDFILDHMEKWREELAARKERGTYDTKLSTFLQDYLENEPPMQVVKKMSYEEALAERNRIRAEMK